MHQALSREQNYFYEIYEKENKRKCRHYTLSLIQELGLKRREIHCNKFSIYVFPEKTWPSLTPKYKINICKK
jgi:hypothetical protein